MISTKTREDLNVLLDNTALERVKFTKFLGVLIDECLTWKITYILHIENYIKNILVSWTNLSIPYTLPYIAYHLLYLNFTLPKLWHTYMGQYLQILFR